MRNLGLIGGGYWGKNLIRDFDKLNILHSVCDIDKKALKDVQQKYKEVSVTQKWSDILDNSEITCVCIALPAHMHYKFTKQAIEAGKNVYVEKPFTLTVEHAEELKNLAEEKNKLLMVGHLLHYHPGIKAMKKMISSGAIGEIRQIVANRYSLGIFRTFENVLWSFGVHDISLILSLCNDELPDSVICNGVAHITPNVHDFTNCILKYSDKYISLNLNWLSPYKEQRISVVGTKGMLVFDDVTKKLQHIPEYIKFSNELVPSNPVAIKNNEKELSYFNEFPLFAECKHFKECCADNIEPYTNAEEGLRTVKVLTELQKSLDNNGIEIHLKKGTTDSDIYIHPTATVDNGAIIGEGTKIWHYTHICSGAKIGKNCNIGQNVFVAGGAEIGDGCKVQNNVSIYKGVTAGNNVFFGPSCVLTNDINPRCLYPKNGEYKKTIIEDGVTLGANCTIVCGNTIEHDALIGAGSVVTKDVGNNSLQVGVPAKNIGSVDSEGNISKFN